MKHACMLPAQLQLLAVGALCLHPNIHLSLVHVKYVFVKRYCKLVKAAGQHSSGGEATREKGTATEPEPVT